jgi:hypothetical protein
MMSLVVPLLLIAVASWSLRRGRVHYESGMTGDALMCVLVFLLSTVMACFYLLGYEVALWHS